MNYRVLEINYDSRLGGNNMSSYLECVVVERIVK